MFVNLIISTKLVFDLNTSIGFLSCARNNTTRLLFPMCKLCVLMADNFSQINKANIFYVTRALSENVTNTYTPLYHRNSSQFETKGIKSKLSSTFLVTLTLTSTTLPNFMYAFRGRLWVAHQRSSFCPRGYIKKNWSNGLLLKQTVCKEKI